MATNSYVRCAFFDIEGHQCETWFSTPEDAKSAMCQEHFGAVSLPERANLIDIQKDLSETKQTFIEQQNIYRKAAHEMSLDELHTHLVGLDVMMENLRNEIIAKRQVHREKLANLSDEERAERRKITLKPEPIKAPKVSQKKDPAAYFQDKHGLSLSMLEMDPDELIARFKKSRELTPKGKDTE